MTTQIAVILEATLATSTGVSKSSDGCITMIDKITATNETGAAATATVQLISPDGALIQSFSKSLLGGASWPFPDVIGHVIDVGGKINVISPTADAIRFRISGRKFT